MPGVACSLDAKLLSDIRMSDKVVLCGSCFSAAPAESDFPAPRGPAMRGRRESFASSAIAGGAVTFYGHMRENSGFPQLYPVLDAWIHGISIGEGYQRMMNAAISFSGLAAGEFVLAESDLNDERAVMRRNELLYVVIGDPALQLYASLGAKD